MSRTLGADMPAGLLIREGRRTDRRRTAQGENQGEGEPRARDGGEFKKAKARRAGVEGPRWLALIFESCFLRWDFRVRVRRCFRLGRSIPFVGFSLFAARRRSATSVSHGGSAYHGRGYGNPQARRTAPSLGWNAIGGPIAAGARLFPSTRRRGARALMPGRGCGCPQGAAP